MTAFRRESGLLPTAAYRELSKSMEVKVRLLKAVLSLLALGMHIRGICSLNRYFSSWFVGAVITIFFELSRMQYLNSV